MEQTILYYNNETRALHFDDFGGMDTQENVENPNDLLVIMIYLLGFYHLSWYIIDSSRRFFTEDINMRLCDCRTVFRIMNENFEMFDNESVEKMNTTELLMQTLDFFGEDCSSTIDSGEDTVEESDDNHSNEEVDVAKTLVSMGKDWEFNQ